MRKFGITHIVRHEVQGGAKNLRVSQTKLRTPASFSRGVITCPYVKNIDVNSGLRANFSFQAIVSGKDKFV